MKIKVFSFVLPLALWCLPACVHGESTPGKNPRNLDWSKRVKQFDLHKHLMTPTYKDLEVGVENSRRLARNAIRLGVDTETHRKLIPDNPPEKLLQKFVPTTPLPSATDPYDVDMDTTVDPLPFGDGPGVFPGLPEGTPGFWNGTSGPTQMWEVVACPVADVKNFLERPWSCLTGDDPNALQTFVESIDIGEIFTNLTTGILVPLAVEVLYTMSGLRILETLFRSVCAIIDIVEKIGAVTNDWSWNPLDWFPGRRSLIEGTEEYENWFGETSHRELSNGEPGIQTCDGEYEVCRVDHENSLFQEECAACFVTEGAECHGCGTCWQPLSMIVPDMGGLCLPTAMLRDFETARSPNIHVTQMLHMAMLSLYIHEEQNSSINIAIQRAFGLSEGQDLRNEILKASEDIKRNTDANTQFLGKKIDDQCPASLGQARRLNSPDKEEKIEEILQSSKAEEVKKTMMSKLGLSEEQADAIAANVLKQFDNPGLSGIMDEFQSALSSPKVIQELEKLMGETFDQTKKNAIVGEVAGDLLREAVNPDTKKFDPERLQEIKRSLAEMQSNGRSLNEGANRCQDVLNNLVNTIKGFMEDGLLFIVEQLQNVGAFDVVDDAFPVMSSVLLMPMSFLIEMNPFNNIFSTAMGTIYEVVGYVICVFLYGSSGPDQTCKGTLPSLDNQVLPIFETRDGRVFMNSGCNSNFEGELAFFMPALDIIEDLLDAAGDAIIEFYNIPVQIVKFIFQVLKRLYEHLDDVCAYLDGYVQLAEVEATYENTRHIMHKLSICEPTNIIVPLQKGYGCDSIDNDCLGGVDDCAEDVFPPEIDATMAFEECAGEIYESEQDAIDCALPLVKAVDDCKPVSLATSFIGTGVCGITALRITATAEGCSGRTPEDVSTVDIPLQIDGVDPTVTCGVAETLLEGKKRFKDIGFSYTATDECAEELDVKIEIFSNELQVAGSEMVAVIPDGEMPHVFVHDMFCEKSLEEGDKDCLITSSSKKSRDYVIKVTATDGAGNAGSATCDMIHVGKNEALGDPLILLYTTVFELDLENEA